MQKQSETIEELTEYNPGSDHISPPLKFYASEILGQLGYKTYDEQVPVLNRAVLACKAMSISVPEHFKHVYRYDGEKTWIDWRLSSLACYLLVVNADPANPVVAHTQLYLFMKNM